MRERYIRKARKRRLAHDQEENSSRFSSLEDIAWIRKSTHQPLHGMDWQSYLGMHRAEVLDISNWKQLLLSSMDFKTDHGEIRVKRRWALTCESQDIISLQYLYSWRWRRYPSRHYLDQDWSCCNSTESYVWEGRDPGMLAPGVNGCTCLCFCYWIYTILANIESIKNWWIPSHLSYLSAVLLYSEIQELGSTE